jgi:hypothetical protein
VTIVMTVDIEDSNATLLAITRRRTALRLALKFS